MNEIQELIEDDTEERLIKSLKKRGYWCPRCDSLAPPLNNEFLQSGRNGFCKTCNKNPLDKDVA